MHYVVKYKLFFHTFNKETEAKIKVESGLSYFDGERNRKVYQQADAVDYVKATHKHEDIEKLFKVEEDVGISSVIERIIQEDVGDDFNPVG